MKNIYDHDHRIRISMSTVNEKYNASISEHLEIITAFLERDKEKVERKMRDHIINSRKVVIERLYGIGINNGNHSSAEEW